jgi:hypothetical protein
MFVRGTSTRAGIFIEVLYLRSGRRLDASSHLLRINSLFSVTPMLISALGLSSRITDGGAKITLSSTSAAISPLRLAQLPRTIHTPRAGTCTAGRRFRARALRRATAKDFPGTYDLIAFFDCLHDMDDPVGAARHVNTRLAQDGTRTVVEPFAADRTEDNFNPIGRLYYAASTTICVPASLSQEVGLGLGTEAGEARLREVLAVGGFSRIRVAASTPLNLIREAGL